MWERGFGGGGGVGGKGIEWVRGIRSVCLYGSLSFSLIYVFEREMKSERARARACAQEGGRKGGTDIGREEEIGMHASSAEQQRLFSLSKLWCCMGASGITIHTALGRLFGYIPLWGAWAPTPPSLPSGVPRSQETAPYDHCTFPGIRLW